jgi:hypothetical protein
MSIVVKLQTDTVSPDLRRKLQLVKRPRTVIEAGAKATERAITKHLRVLQGRGNKMGWPSQGFFSKGKDPVERNVGVTQLNDKGALIEIADPRFLHRITGGVVTAKRRKFLAIPLIAEAYALSGKGSIREAAPGLTLKFPFLGTDENGEFRKWFILVKSVTHSAHPEEQPDTDQLSSDASKAMERAIAMLLQSET